MKNITAVILAAGRGTRLHGPNGGKPKGFLPVLGKTFISRAVDILQVSGVKDVVIVTGHEAGQFENFAATRTGVRCAYNPEFASKGAVQSFIVGLQASSGSVIMLDADIVYETRAVEAVVNAPGDSAIALSSISGLGDENLAWTVTSDRGPRRLAHISKLRSSRDGSPDSEHVGIIRMSAALSDDLRREGGAMADRNPHTLYEECLNHFLPVHPVEGVFLPELVWTEVDDEAMWQHAQENVFPRLALCDAEVGFR
ncbi:NTP transferase domain-containing protein [Aestuariivirga litoralis]|uniref:phosphocholine cytidylyltransferase family protein n=1 Tax=Aestuariivirga litoralis TaxID=2650924 RepID=UPI001FEE4CB2|nr:NTP transferase domain-containing protein [Aestuariivirga litoralis]